MNDKVKFEEFEISKPTPEDDKKIQDATIWWAKELMKAQEIAIREKIFANTVIINENYIKTAPIPFAYGYEIPSMICGLEIHPTKYLLPDNIPFAIFKSPQTEFERKLDEKMRRFTNMVANHLADSFDSPCNYSPLDEEMFDFCGGVNGECNCDDAVECWKRVFKMWQKQDEEEAERRWNEE